MIAVAKPQSDGYTLIVLSDRLAIMHYSLKRPGKGGRKERLHCAYFGFNTPSEASAFVRWLKRQNPEAWTEFREAKRLPECTVEVKVRGFEGLMDVVLKCADKENSR